MKFGMCGFRDTRAERRTDKQTDKHTYTLIATFRTPTRGDVSSKFHVQLTPNL